MKSKANSQQDVVSKIHPLTLSSRSIPWGPGHLVSRVVRHLFSGEINRRVNLAVRALDDARDAAGSLSGGVGGQRTLDRDRFVYDREDVFREALLAWRTNPLARRIVSLTT